MLNEFWGFGKSGKPAFFHQLRTGVSSDELQASE
jgi:hypothetical protein